MEPSVEATGTGPDAGNPLAAALLPILLHRINNVTQLLTSVNAVLALAAADGDDAPGAASLRGQDLAAASSDAEELGWLLGVLGCGLGADLLLERREPRGLDAMVRLVRQALRRAGAEFAVEPEGPWPGITNAAPSHGDLCWIVAYGMWFGGLEGGELRLARDAATRRHVLSCSSATPVDWAALRETLERRLPGAELGSGASGWELSLPPDWLDTAG